MYKDSFLSGSHPISNWPFSSAKKPYQSLHSSMKGVKSDATSQESVAKNKSRYLSKGLFLTMSHSN